MMFGTLIEQERSIRNIEFDVFLDPELESEELESKELELESEELESKELELESEELELESNLKSESQRIESDVKENLTFVRSNQKTLFSSINFYGTHEIERCEITINNQRYLNIFQKVWISDTTREIGIQISEELNKNHFFATIEFFDENETLIYIHNLRFYSNQIVFDNHFTKISGTSLLASDLYLYDTMSKTRVNSFDHSLTKRARITDKNDDIESKINQLKKEIRKITPKIYNGLEEKWCESDGFYYETWCTKENEKIFVVQMSEHIYFVSKDLKKITLVISENGRIFQCSNFNNLILTGVLSSNYNETYLDSKFDTNEISSFVFRSFSDVRVLPRIPSDVSGITFNENNGVSNYTYRIDNNRLPSYILLDSGYTKTWFLCSLLLSN